MKNNVLIISSEFPPGPGGIGSHAFNLSNGLSKRGYKVIINTKSDYVDKDQEVMFDKKCPYKVFRFKRKRTTLQNLFHRLKIITRTIFKYNIKHVIISGEFSIWVIPLIKIYRVLKITTIIHGTELGKNFYLRWTLFCLGKSNKIISVSNFTKSLVPKNLKLKIQVINNGVDIDKWSIVDKKCKLENFPILLTVGSISFRKGQFNVIKFLPQIIKEYPLTHYHCVGNYEDREDILKLINQLKLNDFITLHGILKHSELEKIYSISHVNMMLSNNNNNTDFEGFGISVLEGNLYGVPAIGAKKSGLEDAIRNHHNGELVNPDNIEEVMGALKNIFKDYDKYFSRSKAYAIENKWEKKINQYEKYFQ